MFDMESRPTIVKSVVESADSGIESADPTTDSAIIPLKIGLWVWAFRGRRCCCYMLSDRVRGRRAWQVITEVSVGRDLILGDDALPYIAHVMLI